MLLRILFFIAFYFKVARSQVDNCNGTLLTKSVCLPDTYVKEQPANYPTHFWGKYYNIEVFGVDLKAQTINIGLSLTLYWEDHRYNKT